MIMSDFDIDVLRAGLKKMRLHRITRLCRVFGIRPKEIYQAAAEDTFISQYIVSYI